MWEREVDTSINKMTFTNPTECTDYSNLVVENCRFESTGARTQNIYGMQLNGLTIKNNVFLGANNGTYDDCVKFTELVTYSIKGDVIVQNNIFANFGQYILWFLDIGPSNFQVTHNKFEHVGLCDGGTASLYRAPLTASFPIADLFGEEDKLVINFSKNEVVDANVGFRSDYKDLPAEKVEIKVNYNIFEGIVNAERLIYNNNLDEITEENYAAIDASNNYYDITVSADNFNGVTAWEAVLTNREDALK